MKLFEMNLKNLPLCVVIERIIFVISSYCALRMKIFGIPSSIGGTILVIYKFLTVEKS